MTDSAVGDLDAWDRALRKHVTRNGNKEGISSSLVDYAGMASDEDFCKFACSLETVDPKSLDREHMFAFYINAYNCLAIKMVASQPCRRNWLGRCVGPLRSIKDLGMSIGGPVSSVWFKPAGVLGGKKMSLDAIEQHLRSPPNGFGSDARLHACIVCASLSCPNLRNEAFRPEKLDEQMRDQMREWVSNRTKGCSINRQGRKVKLSKIFLWFKKDFEKSQMDHQAGTVLDFILPCVNEEDQNYLIKHKGQLKIEYFDYNWTLNGNAKCRCISKQHRIPSILVTNDSTDISWSDGPDSSSLGTKAG